MRLLKWLGYLVFGIAVAVVGLFGAARFHDGPLELIPGGPLEEGEYVSAAVTDWSFSRDVPTIEFQLEGDDTSRTVWIVVDGTQAYIPCSLGFPPLKNWHKRAAKDGRGILRIDHKKYRVMLTRVDDEAVVQRVGAVARSKYETPPGTGAGVWFFHIESRAG